jgi:hypothetical protein
LSEAEIAATPVPAAPYSYTETEHARLLVASGCGELRRITLPSGGGIIRASKLQ